MKRWVIIGLLVVGMLLNSVSLSFADDRVRGRWEGVAIGLGAVTLYNLFQYGHPSPVIPPNHSYYGGPVHHAPPVVSQPAGHWEIHRAWIPERREHVWIPAHYENGYWVSGYYQVRVYPGYYEERRAWVEGRAY
jgi:hypothetical protein